MTSKTWTLIPVSLHSFSTDAPSVAISIDTKLSKSITIWGFPTLAYPDLNAAGFTFTSSSFVVRSCPNTGIPIPVWIIVCFPSICLITAFLFPASVLIRIILLFS